ncbi:monooxygenase [Hypoxylon sp. FL0543]|nr:monooxygenase [Hypoxylon sp. FL0543]
MSEPYDVIIAGAGPIGLFLACELKMANVSVLVLERDATPDSVWKSDPFGMRGLNTVSLESFYRRGMMDKVTVKPQHEFFEKKDFVFGGHFAGMLLNAKKLDMSRYKYRLSGPALIPSPSSLSKVEKALTERAESLGVVILRGKGVTGVSQDDNSVTVEAGGETFTAKWLVGCDGGRSTVRKAAGFDFVGTEPACTGYAFVGDLDPPDELKVGFQPSVGGMFIVGRMKSIYLLDFDGGAFDRKQEITPEHLTKVMARVTGTNVKVLKIHHASSFTDRSKQAATYRKGRVLLAGDAAHIHSPLGAQGLNLGIGDAINLGWKLAATVQASKSGAGLQDLSLLDSYERERHPVGSWVLEWTRAQISTLRPDPFGFAVRKLMNDLLQTTDGTNLFIDRIWGLSLRYDLGDEHPLVGCSAPDFELDDGTRLGSKLETARGLLLDFGSNAELKDLTGKYDDKVDYLSTGAKDRLGLQALLIRPDGIVAWAAEEKLDVDAAKAALERWFRLGSK